jgi:hypothetical protein
VKISEIFQETFAFSEISSILFKINTKELYHEQERPGKESGNQTCHFEAKADNL